MSQPTKIEWTAEVARQLGYAGGGHTWNPVRGCSRVSEGCRNCYAERMAARFSQQRTGREIGEPLLIDSPFTYFATMTPSGPRWTGKVELIREKLDEPLKRRKPTVYFVNSMSDLHHEALPEWDKDKIHAVMALCPQHLFLVLTKRASEQRRYWCARERGLMIGEAFKSLVWFGNPPKGTPREYPVIKGPLSNLWSGVSAEDQPTADERISELLQTPAALWFVSYEPALGPVDFRPYLHCENCGYSKMDSAIHCDHNLCRNHPLRVLDWVICGGESGPGARPMHPDWARSVRDQCQSAGVPFFFKQITERGRKVPFEQWPEDLKVREFPNAKG